MLTSEPPSFGCVRGKRPSRTQAVRRSDTKPSNADRDRTHSRSNTRLSSEPDEADSPCASKGTRRCASPAQRRGLQAAQAAHTSRRTAACTRAQPVSDPSCLLHLLSQEVAVGRASKGSCQLLETRCDPAESFLSTLTLLSLPVANSQLIYRTMSLTRCRLHGNTH